MTDDEAFRRAILANPEEDLPRLVYADFLQERGEEARAEFIRLQCASAKLRPDDAEYATLKREESELQLAHQHEPGWSIPGLKGSVHFERGFIESLETSAEWLLSANPDELVLHPIHHLRLVNADRFTTELVSLPLWQNLESLSLNNNNFGVGTRLDLFNAADMPKLRSLSFRNNRLWPYAVRALAETRVAAQLTRLDLSGNPISDEGVEILSQHPAFVGLRELILRSDELSFSDCIHATGGNAIGNSWTLSSLTQLNLAEHYLGDAGLIDIVTSSNADQLVELDVSYNEVGTMDDAAFTAIENTQHLRRLKRLNLAGSRVTRLAARAMANWGRNLSLSWLDLRECEIDPADVALVQNALPNCQIVHHPRTQEPTP
jgi:uncharacterized protein (TIGR02996 family)